MPDFVAGGNPIRNGPNRAQNEQSRSRRGVGSTWGIGRNSARGADWFRPSPSELHRHAWIGVPLAEVLQIRRLRHRWRCRCCSGRLDASCERIVATCSARPLRSAMRARAIWTVNMIVLLRGDNRDQGRRATLCAGRGTGLNSGRSGSESPKADFRQAGKAGCHQSDVENQRALLSVPGNVVPLFVPSRTQPGE